MLHGQSPPVHFTHGGIQYISPPNPYSVPWYTQQAQNQIYRPQRASPPPNQSSPIPAFNLDDDNFEPLWASASQPFQPYSEGPSQPVENDSPVEEVEPVQPKRKYTRRSKPTKKNDKEFVEPWTIEEEIALCKAFVAKSEDSVQGNGKKAAGFWREVAEHFHEEMGEDKRSYDSVNCKWKNRIRPKVSQFCEIYNSVRDRHQSGSCDNTVYQEAELEYRTIYNAPFTLTECWKILKDHPKWKKEIRIGVNLNDEAADSEDVEAQEVPAPIGRDRAKKKGSSSGARSETSIAGDPSLVDALLSKFTMAATPFFTQRKESSSEYLQIKERELELEERKRQEQGELERLRIGQRNKELDLQQKFEEDLQYYNEDHDHLSGRALSTALFLKHKFNVVGFLSRYKVRLVTNGRSQQQGIDCDETISSVVKPTTIRTVLSLVVSRHWPNHQLNRSLYGLKQAPRAWFYHFAIYVTQIGFQHSNTNSSLFVFHRGSDIAYLLLYVDDIILIAFLQRITTSLHSEFAMTDLVCLCIHDPREPHYTALKRILRYIRDTIDHGLQLHVSFMTQLTAYTNADWAGCPITRRFTLGYCVFLGDNLLSWSAKRHATLSRFSAEAKYCGVANVVPETAWLRNFLRELHAHLFTTNLVYCDNASAVYLSINLVQHQRTKHIEIDIHFVHDFVASRQVHVLRVPSRFQYANIFTKGLPRALFLEFRDSLNVQRPLVLTAREY
ncbi:ribonuclease H-like domain-containing protein [Tanacetum coccineum]